MPLKSVELAINGDALPRDVTQFLNDADARIAGFAESYSPNMVGFVPSDFVTVYRALRAIAESNLAAGDSFCEWGSGFGVVASLAAMLDFRAHGIEIHRDLVDAAETLAADYDLPVEFIHGSFVPAEGDELAEETYTAESGHVSWLDTSADGAYDRLGLEPEDFDLVFAYPWPGEELVIDVLFERYAAEGALLLTYNQYDSVLLRRKINGRGARRRR